MENILIEIDKRIKKNTELYRITKGLESLEYQARGLELLKFQQWLLKYKINKIISPLN